MQEQRKIFTLLLLSAYSGIMLISGYLATGGFSQGNNLFFRFDEGPVESLPLTGEEEPEVPKMVIPKPEVRIVSVIPNDNAVEVTIRANSEESDIAEYFYGMEGQDGADSWQVDTVEADEHTVVFEDVDLSSGMDVYASVYVVDALGNTSATKKVLLNRRIYDLTSTEGAYSDIDVFDLSVVLSNWDWKDPNRNEVADVNQDGEVDIVDVSLILSHWGE